MAAVWSMYVCGLLCGLAASALVSAVVHAAMWAAARARHWARVHVWVCARAVACRPVSKGLICQLHADLQAAERLFTVAKTVAPTGECGANRATGHPRALSQRRLVCRWFSGGGAAKGSSHSSVHKTRVGPLCGPLC